MSVTGNYQPEYWRDLYGDAAIAYVPPVSNYLYNENLTKRGINDRDFRWEEVTIDLEQTQSGAVLDFLMPDYYLLQITPDIGWHDVLAMFGETHDPSIHNPHLQSLGPFSITAGTLNNNGDNSVTVSLTEEQMSSAVIDGFPNYLWRAVPWGQGNPGQGGLPASFEWISSRDQLIFIVDPWEKESKKSTQTISGTKGPRVTITTESENNPTVFVEQTSTTWKVIFSIDRPIIKFKIVATDEGGSAFTKYNVDISYPETRQYDSHVWNAFDSFALLASLERLPNEDNDELKARTIDAFTNKGGTHYQGLLNGINRELGLKRKDKALKITRRISNDSTPIESQLEIETTHTMVCVHASSFVIYDEHQKIDDYLNEVVLSNPIKEILSIKTIGNQEILPSDYKISDKINRDDNTILIDSKYSGIVKVTYLYKKNYLYKDYPTIGDVISVLTSITNQSLNNILDVTVDSTIGGSEPSKYLYKTFIIIDQSNREGFIGWSPIGLFAVADEQYKWSFADENSIFFNSEFYKFVLELKSQTNIEWGFIVIDKDYWDAIDADWYGKDSLPIALDINLSKYVTALPINNRSQNFDAWEAFRMSYYFDSNLIKNQGMPQVSFKSGVGYKPDCIVSVVTQNVSSQDTKINFNPLVTNSKDVISYSNTAIQSIAVNL